MEKKNLISVVLAKLGILRECRKVNKITVVKMVILVYLFIYFFYHYLIHRIPFSQRVSTRFIKKKLDHKIQKPFNPL